MAQSTQAAELIGTISQRSNIISYLVENDKPVSKQTISSDLELARSTVDEVTRNLREEGLLESTATGHVPTLFATLVWDAYESFAQSIAEIGASEDDTTPMWPTETERQEVMGLVAARLDILECARTPHDKRDLVDDLAVSRSTVDRAIRELEIVGLVAWMSDGYVTTTPARRAVDQYRATVEAVADVLAAREVLAVLSPDSPLQSTLLTDSTVEYAADAPPYHLPEGVRDRIVAADRVRLYLPVLATPQLLDCCQQQVIHGELTLDLLTDSSLYQTLSAEFPGPLSSIAGNDHCTALVADTPPDSRPPFGLLLAETERTTTVSVITYGEQRTIHGTIHNCSAAAVRWAKEWYESVYEGAADVTDELRALGPAGRTTTMGDSERLALESEGFVQLTPAYFSQRAPSSPITGWRTGFDLVDVHAGYAIDRGTERDGTRCNFTEALTERLTAGTNITLLGTPGSGKSTACKSVACRWYEQGRGPVFYRESGRGMTVPQSSVLSGHLRETDGHALVVVEDAVRAEANAIFRLMRAFRGTDAVTFLLDARKEEWDDPERLPIDAGLEAYRHEDIETVPVPAFDDTEAERLVGQFEQTTGRDLDSTLVSHLCEDGIGATEGHEKHTPMSNTPGALLLFLHRLVLAVEPLAVYDANTPTSLVEDVQRTYEDLRRAGELALDVGVFVNLLNAAGIGFDSALVCALATAENAVEIDAIRDALSTLEGRVLFAREETVSRSVPYQVAHEKWSTLFLDHLLDAEGDRTASRRVGRCVTVLLSLADKKSRRDRLTAAFRTGTSLIERIADAPSEWADTIVEQLYGLGLRHRGLAPLFGTANDSFIDLPEACSQSMVVNCTLWRIQMLLEAGDVNGAERECETLAALIDDVETRQPEWAATLRGRRLNGLGIIAWYRSEYDTAKRLWTRAIEHYREAGNKRRLAQTHAHLGGVAYYHGDTQTAEASFTQSLETFRDIGPAWQEASTLSNLGVVVQTKGELVTAIDYYRQAIDLVRETSDPRHEARILADLGIAVAYNGDLDGGKTYCIQALELSREGGISKWEAVCLDRVSQISLLQGDINTAERYCKQGLDIRRELSDKRNEAKSLLSWGIIARERGVFDTAIERCTTSHEIFQEVGDRIFEARSLTTIGTITREQGDLDTAHEHAQNSLTLHRETGDFCSEAKGHRLLGRIAHDRERFTAAEDHLTQAQTDFRASGYRCEQARTLASLGTLARAQSNTEHARERFEASIELCHDIGMIRDAVQTAEQLVAVCETLGDPDAALTHCERACDLVRETEFVESSAPLRKRRDRLAEQLTSDDTAR